MPAPGSPLHVHRSDGLTVVTFRDRILLDTEELNIIERDLLALIDEQEGVRLVIDFGNVQSLSSQMLGALLKVADRMERTRGRVALCNLNARIKEAFEITRLKKILRLYDSQAAAVKSVRREGRA